MIACEIFHNMKRLGDGKEGLMAFKLDLSKVIMVRCGRRFGIWKGHQNFTILFGELVLVL